MRAGNAQAGRVHGGAARAHALPPAGQHGRQVGVRAQHCLAGAQRPGCDQVAAPAEAQMVWCSLADYQDTWQSL